MTGLRILIAIPVGWTISSDFVKRITAFSSHEKHNVSIFYELSATRLDFSLSKIIALAKRFNPDVTLRFDADCLPAQELGDVVSLVRQDFSRGFGLVFSPTRHVNGSIMMRPREDSPSNDLPDPDACSEAFYGALGYSAMSPELIEAWRPHAVDYGPFDGHRRQVRYICTDWKKPAPPVPDGWKRKTELAEVDPELNTHVPMYVVNPPDNSEDEDICFDLRSNGFRIGCDARLKGTHFKKYAIPNYGSLAVDAENWRKAHGEEAKT